MYSLNPYDGHSNYKIDLDIKDKTSFFHFSFIITYPNVETLELAINRKTKKIFDPLDSRKNWTLWEELDVVEIFWQYSIETNRENEPYQEWQVSTSSMGFNLEIIKPRICYLTPMKKFSSYSVARENQLQMRIDIEIPKIMDLQKNGNPTIVIRSTLPLGACEHIEDKVGPIIYIPEFLRERYWDTDCLKRPLVVGYNSTTILPDWLLEEEIYKCNTTEAELVKMFSNSFATMRIAFANVFYDLSQSVGADYDTVKDMFFKIQQDQTYMEVPGHDGTRGFGGKCLPKDLDFLIDTLDEHNIDQNWFKHIRELNKRWKEKF